MIALTATAESHIRRDILERLHLRQARCYISSFDRPNIRYTVLDKNKPLSQLTDFLRNHTGEAGIVYCLSRKRVDSLAAKLKEEGFNAAPYHAGLSTKARQKVQDDFLRDDVLIMVATVAFGMGIDKSNIRFVVHYDIPKNIESYYQETGRAGRDSLAAEALLLFGYGDIAIARSLIENTHNQKHKRIELHKLNAVVAFGEASSCRRQLLLGYFDERMTENCGNCDICLHPPEMIDATEDARKALSCVYRVNQRFGMGHVIDEELFRRLRNLRKTMADAARVPPFVIFSDKSLVGMSAELPTDNEAFLNVHGVGIHKLERYGEKFLAEIRRQLHGTEE